MDLRITAAAWRGLRDKFGADPAITPSRNRRDWIELALTSDADLARLLPVLTAAVAANRGAGAGVKSASGTDD